MNPTENKAADVLFAEWLLPLRHANLRRRISYLDCEPRRESYWCGIASRTGGIERLSTRSALALLALWAEYLTQRNDADLLQLLPALKALQQELTGAARGTEQAEQRLTEFVYPLY